MMENTPRAVVGRATFSIAAARSGHCAHVVREQLLAVPGVIQVIADDATGTVTVTVDRPVDRADIAAAAGRAGHCPRYCG